MKNFTAAILTPTLALLAGGLLPLDAQKPAVSTIVDFGSSDASSWYRVNDGVMGGRSSSGMRSTGEGSVVFEGNLSLENNGGFASVRTELPAGALAGARAVVLRVRGDGQRYQVRLRPSRGFDGVAFGAGFETRAGEWITVSVRMDEFEPTFRGYRPRNALPLDPADVRQLGIMLTDKQEGPFALEIKWIGIEPAAS